MAQLTDPVKKSTTPERTGMYGRTEAIGQKNPKQVKMPKKEDRLREQENKKKKRISNEDS